MIIQIIQKTSIDKNFKVQLSTLLVATITFAFAIAAPTPTNPEIANPVVKITPESGAPCYLNKYC